MRIRYLLRCLALLLCTAFVAAPVLGCTPTNDREIPSGDNTPPATESLLTIADVELARFCLVRDEYADEKTKALCVDFRDRLNRLYSADIKLTTDYIGKEEQPSPYEIVLGKTNREDAPALPDADSAIICVKNGRLFLRADDPAQLEALFDTLIDQILTDKNGEVIPVSFREGYMKEYKGSIALVRNDGGQTKTDAAFSDFSYGVTGHHKGYAAYPVSQLETQIRLTAELGVTIYRFNYNPVSDEDFAYMHRVLDLCDAYGLDMMLVLDDHGGSVEEIAQKHENIAKRCKGRIAYYQIFNETDVYAMHKEDGSIYHQPVGTGESIAQFNPARVSEITEKLRASIAVFRENDPDAKLVVNFAFKHYAIIKAFVEAGLEWDVLGVDWYSDMESNEPLASFLPRVQTELPDFEYMICECNIWAHNAYTEEEQAAYLEAFVLSLADSDVKNLTAIIFYELLDEPAYNNGESHFGLIKNDMNGTPQDKKMAYGVIQSWLCGGEVSAKTVLAER